MSAQGNSPPTHGNVGDLLIQIEKQGTPFRIDGTTETYYVLSADQLMALLRAGAEDGESIPPFTPRDFGLTEADLVAYQARQKARRQRVHFDALVPLDTDLEQRLRRLSQIQGERSLSDKERREREQLLHELETSIVHNLQAAVT